MNIETKPPAAPALDPIRALHVEAFDALIDRRLADTSDLIGCRAAQNLLLKLESEGLADVEASGSTGAIRMTMYGITAAATTANAYGTLRGWQTAARNRLSLNIERKLNEARSSHS